MLLTNDLPEMSYFEFKQLSIMYLYLSCRISLIKSIIHSYRTSLPCGIISGGPIGPCAAINSLRELSLLWNSYIFDDDSEASTFRLAIFLLCVPVEAQLDPFSDSDCGAFWCVNDKQGCSERSKNKDQRSNLDVAGVDVGLLGRPFVQNYAIVVDWN